MVVRILIALSLLSINVNGQNCTHLQIKGRYVTGTCGDTIILKGVNYAPYNWGYTANENYFEQIALTKANSVRIVWFKNSTSAIYNNLVYLDSALARCIRAKMIPIVELHDATCSGNMADVTALLPFYISTGFKALEQKYRNHLIINIANEAGYYAWTANPANALITYKTTYKNAVTTLRNNGLQVPIMIDAPDCGTNSDAFVNAGAEILAADVLSNTMFSVHGYWYGFAGNNPATMNTKVQALYNSGLCVYFGEIANQQDDASPCQYNLAYTQLLTILKNYNIGWSAWGWYHDVCPLRQISNNGNANNLSAYGQVIVNDAALGLKQNAIQPLQFNSIPGYNCGVSAGEITGPLNSCAYTGIAGGTAIYSISTTGATSISWNLPAGASLVSGQETASISVKFDSAFISGNIAVTVGSPCTNPITKTLAITKSIPVSPEISGPSNACIFIGTNTPVTYSVAPVPGAITYRWGLPANTTLYAASPDSLSVTLLFNAAYPTGTSAQKSIKVRSISGCGSSADKYLSIFSTPPATPIYLKGPTNICANMMPEFATYTTRKVANASGYLWTIPPAGATIIDHPAGTGANDTVITVQFNNLFPVAPNPEVDFIGVAATSPCGTSLARKLSLVRIAPSAAGAISGKTDVCLEMAGLTNPSGTPLFYTIRKIPNATSYQWTIPPAGTTIVSHPGGTGINDTIIQVLFNAGFPVSGGTISVKGINGCFSGTERTLYVKPFLPSPPGLISGPADPCTNIWAETNAVYTIRKVNLAESYIWSTVNNSTGGAGSITITGHPGGTGLNDTIVSVDFNPGFLTGAIRVQSVRNCGTSALTSQTLITKKVAMPATIEGNPTPCIGAIEIYTCGEVPNASSYTWTIPVNAKILSGQGTNQVTISFPETDILFKTGKIGVTAQSPCGNSATKFLSITKCIALITMK